MKKIIPLSTVCSLILLLVFSCSKEGSDSGRIWTEREDQGFQGKVKTVLIERARYKQEFGEWLLKKRKFRSELVFDKAGKLIKKIRRRRRSRKRHSIKYEYNKSGRRIKTLLYRNGTLRSYGIHSYGKKGYARGKRIMTRWYRANGKQRRKIEISYPESDTKKIVIFNKEGSFRLYVIQTLNSKRLRIKSEWFNTEKKVIRRSFYTYTYDKQGNWISRLIRREKRGADKKQLIPRSMTYRKITYY